MKILPSVSIANPAPPEHQIRERAYYRWLDLGRPDGDDQAHWFWACEQHAALAKAAGQPLAPAIAPSAHFSIQSTVATGLGDPTHRFHNRRTPRDARLDVVAGEARQRMRGRHFDSSLRATPKPAQP